MFKNLSFTRKSGPAARVRTAALGAAAMVLAGTSLFTSAGSASAGEHPGWNYKNQASGLCLDASGGGTSNGTAVIQWECNYAAANQKWSIDEDRFGRPTLRLALTNKCLDISGESTSPGAGLILWECNSGWNQVWLPENSDDCPGSFSGSGTFFVNPYTGHAVDDSSGGRWGAQMTVYPSWHGSNQKWCV
ncbi:MULTISPECIES: RICIN domain-containing protein [Streptomyces]|uniref:RICIN domain-containing protein n=1 Tax=Streptomyces solicathayae TaxID=3081768 RepID=A0ABZ0LW26_9ACTN|nr:RICIN domain-containing protein [Streptomyces sp. HUAS YS2]WOX23697.1 RICIN domain-containing protein [Streptomyces sp. HUAS YS2]